MKYTNILLLAIFALALQACAGNSSTSNSDFQYQYIDILDIEYTPSIDTRCSGWFVDQGAWIGFTPPDNLKWNEGLSGPYSLDYRTWLAESAVIVRSEHHLTTHNTKYYPGLLQIESSDLNGNVILQSLVFADANTAILKVVSEGENSNLEFTGKNWIEGSEFTKDHNSVIIHHPTGEVTVLSFQPEVSLEVFSDNYVARNIPNKCYVSISTFRNKSEKTAGIQNAFNFLNDSETVFIDNNTRWNRYLSKLLRDDTPQEYNRIAVKSLVTLLSNWKVSRGGLLHEGMVPSHAVGYFMGFWAWDTWKFVIPLAEITPELSKNMIRSMFDYQLEDGMIIDCIYVDASENNARDSKPPLAAWAVDAVFNATNDTTFLREMYPQLVAYYNWWYTKRDHNNNGFCEFGSTDGTVEAAAWESGMDNAIRFDNASMLKNAEDAWSFNQESVDLNSFLAYEYTLLSNFSEILGEDLDAPNRVEKVADYFFDDISGFFYDRKIGDGTFIKEPGSEAYIPFWANLASEEQMDRALVMFTDSSMFSTFIPFPTIAANNPKYMSNGYWRGPIWLDQTILQ